MDQEFYMTLSSNNTTDSGNTIALFDTQLQRTYELDNSWYVGLAELSYTKSWFNLRKDARVMVVDENEGVYPSALAIKAGFYQTESALASTINDVVSQIEIENVKHPPEMGFDLYSRRAVVSHGEKNDGTKLYLWLAEDLAEMLGLRFHGPTDSTIIDEDGIMRYNTIKAGLTSIRAYDISAGIHSLFVYCDLIEPSFVGDDFSNVIRSVNVNHTEVFGRDCECVFNPIQYYKLSRSKFQRISIGLYDDAGEVIPFKFGRTKIVLHFKRNGDWMGGEILS